MGIDAGILDHVVNIQQATQTQDSTTGEITKTWSNLVVNEPCSIEDLSVKDFIQSRAHQSEITTRIKIRYRPGLDATMRLVGICDCHSGKIYNPQGWLQDNETGVEWLTAPCSLGVNSG